MLNDLSENRRLKLALPIGRIRVPKFLYVILVVLLVLVLAVGGSSVYLKKFEVDKSKTISSIPVKLTNLEIVKKTLSWLDGQRDERGVYNAGLKCDFKSNCEAPISTDGSGASVLWAEYKYTQKNGDEKERERFHKDVALYANRSAVKDVNDNFWNCYLMWDIWKKSGVGPITEDNLKKICFDSTYQSSDVDTDEVTDVKKTKEIVDNLVLDLIDNKAIIDEQLVSNLIVDEDLVENAQKNQYLFSSSNKLARYLWKKDEKDLLGGLSDFQQSIEAYKNRQVIGIKAYEGCQIGVASSILTSIFTDRKYYLLSKMILDQQIQKINKNSIRDVSVCGFLADKLYEVTLDETFKEKKIGIIKDFLINNFDQKNGGFYSKTETQLIKDIKYNGLMIGILVN